MSVNTTDWQRRSALFDEVSELPTEARVAWFAALEKSEPRHLAAVKKMLTDFDRTDSKMDHAPSLIGVGAQEFAAKLDVATVVHASSQVSAGNNIGAWRLERKIGEGGMGAVWLAARHDGNFAGHAAIKFLRTGLGKTEVVERFLRERRLLARLTHPGIARMIDAGTHEGEPYLVMEYVDGLPITEWAATHAPRVADRVALLLKVCRAAEHAHAQLIVHRDLKPSNVLVNNAGEPSLLDFGIAKLIDNGDDEFATALTRITGRGFTLGYCAPEQITGEPTGVAADVFSMGVLLFELLTGTLPFKSASNSEGRAALEHAIVHTEAKSISRALSENSAMAPKRPDDATRATGDLEAIVAKALRKKPADRYPTLSAFSADLERWLNNLPVAARRGNWQYKTGLWLKRNRTLAAVTTVAFIAVSGGMVAAIWQASRASDEAVRANKEAIRADIERKTALDERRRAEIATAQTSAALAESELAKRNANSNAIKAQQSEQRAIVAAQDSTRSLTLTNNANKRTESAKQFLAGMFDQKRFERYEPGKRGEFPVRELLLQSAQDLRATAMAPDLKSELLVEASSLFRNIDDDPSALAAAREALAIATPLKANAPEVYRKAVLSLLAAFDSGLPREDAKSLLAELLAELERDGLTKTAAYATALAYRGEMLFATKGPAGDGRADIRRAALIFEALGLVTQQAQMVYRWAYMTELGGDSIAAMPEFERAIALYKLIGENGSRLADVELRLASALRRVERIDEAIARYESAIAINERVLGKTHSSSLSAKLAFGFVLVNYGQQARGIAMITEAYEQAKIQNLPPITIFRAGSTLARALVGEGDPVKVMQLSREARDYYKANKRAVGEISNLETMAQAALFSEDFSEAIKLANEADDIAERTYGKTGIQRDVTRVMKAFVLTSAKHPSALSFIDKTIGELAPTVGMSTNRVLLQCYRAQALVTLGKFSDAQASLAAVRADAEQDGMRLLAIYYLSALELARASKDDTAVMPMLEKLLIARVKGNGTNATQTQMVRLELATEWINKNKTNEAKALLKDVPDGFVTTYISPTKAEALREGIELLDYERRTKR